MTKYESDIRTLNTSSEKAFELLSNFSNFKNAIEKVGEQDAEKVKSYLKDVTFDNDSIRVKSHGVGEVAFRIIEREPHKMIKIETENSPVNANLWIQFVEKSEMDTKMRITIHAKIPKMFQMMIGNKISMGINKVADAIAIAINKSTTC